MVKTLHDAFTALPLGKTLLHSLVLRDKPLNRFSNRKAGLRALGWSEFGNIKMVGKLGSQARISKFEDSCKPDKYARPKIEEYKIKQKAKKQQVSL